MFMGLGLAITRPQPPAAVVLPAPTVTGIVPNSGPTAGGTAITDVQGTGFQNGATVGFLSAFTHVASVFVSSTQLTCVSPAGPAGLSDIRVTNPDTQSGTGTNLFTYVAPPVVTAAGVTPNVGDTAGAGQPITIPGTGFVSGCTVTIGGVAATSVVFGSATSITCVPGAHAAGVVHIVVTNPDGQTSGTSGNNAYEYWTPAQITGISAYLDSNKGVTVAGSNVTSWIDQANANDFVQAVNANRPVRNAALFGALPGITFVQQKWVRLAGSVPLATARSVFWVGKTTSTDAAAADANNVPLTVVGDSTGGCFTAAGMSAGALAYQQYIAGTNEYLRGSGLNSGGRKLMGWTHSAGGDLKGYSAATQQGTTESGVTYDANNAYDSIGASQSDLDSFIGDLGAVIIVDQVITAGDLTKLNKWSMQRFGTP